jgi:hypothetical protein
MEGKISYTQMNMSAQYVYNRTRKIRKGFGGEVHQQTSQTIVADFASHVAFLLLLDCSFSF